MNVVVEQCKFINGLKAIRGSVGKGKGQNISDSTVHMEILNQNGISVLRLTTTNFNEWMQYDVDVISCSGNGVFPLVDYERLLSIIYTINSTIEIDLSSNNERSILLNYVGRKEVIEFNTTLPDGFILPPPEQSNDVFNIPGELLVDGINKSSNIINVTENAIFNCVAITFFKTRTLFECIDALSKRMLCYMVNANNAKEGKVFVECQKLKQMLIGYDVTKNIEIGISNNSISINQDNIKSYLRLVSGNFPNLVAFMPKQYKSKYSINKQELIYSLTRVKAMLDKTSLIKSCLLTLENVSSTITSNSTCGKINEIVVTHASTPDVEKKAFLVDTLLNTIKLIEDANIDFIVYENGTVVLQPAVNTNSIYKCLIQQVQVKN